MPSSSYTIQTVDLSPFLLDDGDEDGKKKVKDIISKACSEYGFFQIVNHGVPLDLMNQAIELSKTFFDYSDEEKLKSSPKEGAFLPFGYNKPPDYSADKNEFLFMFPPDSSFNVLPADPPKFRGVMEDMFCYFTKTGQILENIINECLGFPPNFLKEFNNDRSCDAMVGIRYFPATEGENSGISEHEDSNVISFVLQDDVGGLEVRKDGQWIPVIPAEGTLVVNVSDVIQVLSNNKFKSATHRVVRAKGKSRYSYAFFYNIQGDKWIEPLPEFTSDIGEKPKYRRFHYQEYMTLRMRNKTHPPSRPEDVIHITHYAIPN